MKKKILMVMMMAVMGLSVFACSDTENGKIKDRVANMSFTDPEYPWGEAPMEPLTVWGVYPELDRSYIKKAFERYESLTGNQLDIVQISQEQFEEQMRAAFGDGDIDKPDIVLSYGGTSIEAYDPEENFYDFSDAIWIDDLTDTSINQTIYNGRIIGLPHWEASVSGTLYNKKIFKKYHLEIPKTQEEFLAVCEELSQQGITPVYMPGKEISMLLYQFPLDSVVEESKILEGLNNGALNYSDLPQMKQIVEWYRRMARKGYFGATYLTDDWDGMSEAMNSGKYAMMFCWDTWLYTDFKGNAENFGLMPAFMGVPDNGTFEGPNLGLFIVNKNSEKLETALDFITFLADPYNYNAAFEGIYTAPVFKNQVSSISTPQYLEAERLIERNFRDSTAWLRIRGFSQQDASCILKYMDPQSEETAEECLQKMDTLRITRLSR